jgi:isopentenyl-diphosphate delta-isomerase type 1
MEFVDVLDENGEISGIVKARKAVHRSGDLHRTVHVWIMNSRQELLLQKRARTKNTHPGLWDMACAGHITHGDTSLETAEKEIAEELGVHIPSSEIRFLFSVRSCYSHRNGLMTDNELHDVYLVLKDIPLSDFVIQTDEVENIMYMSLTDFQKKVQAKDPCLVPHFDEFEKMCRLLADDFSRFND